MDPPTPWTYNPRGWVEWPLSCLHSEFSPITPPHPLFPYFPVQLNHPRVLPWTHSLMGLPSLLEHVDPRCSSSSARGWSHSGLPGGYYSCEWHGTRDKAPHTTTPILQVITNEPQTPGTEHKKITRKPGGFMQSCFFLVLSYLQCFLVYLLQYLKDTINIIPQSTTRYAVLCENRVTQIWKIVIQLDFTHKYEYFEVQHAYDFIILSKCENWVTPIWKILLQLDSSHQFDGKWGATCLCYDQN